MLHYKTKLYIKRKFQEYRHGMSERPFTIQEFRDYLRAKGKDELLIIQDIKNNKYEYERLLNKLLRPTTRKDQVSFEC